MQNSPQRLQYSPLQIFMFGGLTGSVINLVATIFMHDYLRWPGLFSFFLGTLLNELYHHVYYHLIFVNREIKMKTAFFRQFFLYVLVALGGTPVLWFFSAYLKLSFSLSLVLAIGCLSLLNALLVRISHFGSFALAHVEYRALPESYYNDQTDPTRVSRFRAWYHASRFVRLKHLVEANYQPGMAIADLGCGNCLWNTAGLPVTGVDVHEKMLQWAMLNRRLTDYRVTDNLARTDLPAKQFAMVIMSETLEHLPNIAEVLSEVRRILKDDGKFFLTVPYDIFLGPFFLLFNLNCVYLGYLRGSRYHRYRCGHINHFTKKRLRDTLTENGFTIWELFVVNGLLLYGVAARTGAHPPAVPEVIKQ